MDAPVVDEYPDRVISIRIDIPSRKRYYGAGCSFHRTPRFARPFPIPRRAAQSMKVAGVLFAMLMLILYAGLAFARPAQAQPLEEGSWSVLMLTPGGEVAEATYEVRQSGGAIEATMKWLSGEVPIMDLHLEGDRLSFAWNPSFHMQCRLERAGNRQFKGACKDERENLGPAVISPPGMEAAYADLDFDKAFEIWGVSREEYLSERYPQPATLAPPDVAEPEPMPSRSVEVNGRSLHLVEVGSGDFTVVLVAGIGDDHQIWRHVQEGLADHARVVSYDRPGLGRSDDAPLPRSPSDMAQELHELLGSAGYAPPFVLVGHQAGSFTARAFEAMFPDAVAGIVLVDPSHEEEDDRYGALDAAAWDEYVSRRSAFFAAISEAAAREFDGYLSVLRSDAVRSAPKAARTAPKSERSASKAERSAPASERPVIVLAGQGVAEEPRWIGETENGLKEKLALQGALAREMGGELVVSEQSTSYIHMEDPDLVVDAVKRVLAATAD